MVSKGFNLTELLVVSAIAGVIAMATIPSFKSALRKAEVESIMSSVEPIKLTIQESLSIDSPMPVGKITQGIDSDDIESISVTREGMIRVEGKNNFQGLKILFTPVLSSTGSYRWHCEISQGYGDAAGADCLEGNVLPAWVDDPDLLGTILADSLKVLDQSFSPGGMGPESEEAIQMLFKEHLSTELKDKMQLSDSDIQDLQSELDDMLHNFNFIQEIAQHKSALLQDESMGKMTHQQLEKEVEKFLGKALIQKRKQSNEVSS